MQRTAVAAYVREQARRTLHAILRPVAALLAALTLVYVVAPPVQPATPIATAFGCGALALVAIDACLRRWAGAPVHVLALAAVLATAAQAVTILAATREPAQTVTVIIVLLAASWVLLSRVSALVFAALAVGAWAWIARDFPPPLQVHWGVNLGVATAIALVLQQARYRGVCQEADTLAALLESEERHRLVVESALDAVVTSDAWGHVGDWNPQAERLFGWTAAEARALGVAATIIPPDEREGHEAALAAFRADGGGLPLGQRMERQIVRRDGTRLPVEVAIVPMRRGNEVIFTSWIRDLSERRRAEQAAAAAARAKSDFLATMSHEIRTPIHGIIGMTDIAIDTDDAVERDEVLRRARVCAETLLGIVNDVLDFSKIEAGRLDLQPRPVTLASVLDGVLDTLAVEADAKKLTLVGSVDPALPAMVTADATRLRQVVLNLAGNAVKFTDAGEVEIRFEASALPAADGVRLRGIVRDTGIGIPPEKLREVFDAFTQVAEVETSRHGGTGLGLAISRRLVALMGGTLSVESTLGLGSTFTFTCDLASAPGGADATRPAPPRPGLRVLVLEPNATSRGRLTEMLRSWAVTPVPVADAAGAAAALATGGPVDLALVDVAAPGAAAALRTCTLVGLVPIRWGRARALDGVPLAAVVPRPLKAGALLTVLSQLAPAPRLAAAG